MIIMTKELAKNFDSKEAELRLYQLWEAGGFFNPDNLDLPENTPSYTIILPPPNITDKLHIGHAATLAIEDLFVRFYRMSGFRTLWIPGTDHAAIATQTAVEKKIKREENLTRQQLGKPEFLKRVDVFVKETQAVILNQVRQLGSSLDWSRLAFTLDAPRQTAVKELFVRMHEAGLLYRGERIVNWCPRCQSTLADDEVEHQEQQAKFYTFRYASDFPIVIATTRPETKLGDTAVAVNPKDKRYSQYIGQEFTVDFCGQVLKIKIIGDRHVDMAFGTGALGVTPAHSAIDWQMAEANHLPIIKVIDEQGKIHDGFGRFSGLSALEAREMVVEDLKNNNLLVSEEDISNNLSVCYRCDTPIEPLPSLQWFMSVDTPVAHLGGKSLKAKALEAVESGELEFLPARFQKKYQDWVINLKDWCVSRQIWFGHSIPAWYKGTEVYVGRTAPVGDGWVADQDTLDTWFSSGMWTFSTLGWPDTFAGGVKSGDLLRFHPTQVLETGYELITLWISRMVILSYFAVGELPFTKTYLHGMVLDVYGKKMSKSKGNGIDPLIVGETYGMDAVRLSLLSGITAGNDSKYHEEKTAVARNFVNKLWNVSRFILTQAPEPLVVNKAELTLADAWILSRLESVKISVTDSLTKYEFSAAAEDLRVFTWDELADWYLESTKFMSGQSTPAVLRYVLLEILKLWHPFIPFVTEELWQATGEGGYLIVVPWPKANQDYLSTEAEKDFAILKSVVVAIRTVRSENKLDPTKKLPAIIYTKQTELFESVKVLLKSLRTGVDDITIAKTGEAPADALYCQTAEAEIYLPVTVDKTEEIARLTKNEQEVKAFIDRLEKQLANAEFVNNAPTTVVNKERNRLVEFKDKQTALAQALAKLKNLL
ncbi:valine--tRNA ligase [Candidatus Falkowbacteria bacterium CG10_big_fil_rev_8_21_14_0_10_37_14]|uniref:Valine--tRNA ligase n=1 Tax=Candidatus Falkowbacteria bacterium CG10_big_fil_rev_8_21_14_0_10_37_14 TaxID=1974561 RepID=A0A2M6WUI3_9BACT|nr:MAG: valine--tRNA ligase [Candidatus Falkowbacteria bacterium CG10_big_fil_rev_8_21_14_0_10_37_14]